MMGAGALSARARTTPSDAPVRRQSRKTAELVRPIVCGSAKGAELVLLPQPRAGTKPQNAPGPGHVRQALISHCQNRQLDLAARSTKDDCFAGFPLEKCAAKRT